MPGVANGNSPSYISAHSADVILSDIRPIKLRPEALGAINVLLDEFLHIILTTSQSLTTEKLRTSLLTVLPTSLGKEALLEAEVELRAYSERTGSKALPGDDNRTFHLQWYFELLRLKCCAYSTLNEDDEDPAAEVRVNEVFSKGHSHSPQVALLDPAALYLTAIIESVCEHILSNVGRVAARDSSRTYATTNDLFVALCEDDSIYGFFRSMRVYEQIANLSERPPRHRRSKSNLQHEQASVLGAPSPQPDLSTMISSQSRESSEGQTSNTAPATGSSRTSVEKMRMKEPHKAHRKTDSIRSDVFRQDSIYSTEDEAMQREFDDLMRSTSTMKMSLTPDRLKTMEAYKLEKDQKSSNRRPETLFPTKSSGAQPSRKSSVGQIQSSSEDSQTTKNRSRQGSVSSQPISAFQAIVPTRLRSLSTSGSSWKKPARTLSLKRPPQTSFHSSSASINMAPTQNFEKHGYPQRTRTKSRKRESMNLDDVIGDSDEEPDKNPSGNQSPRPPIHTKHPVHIPHKVSAGTRDLIEFLAAGPPEVPRLSKAGKELVDFLAEGPSDYASSTVSLDKSKGSGRLQKMMSKLNLGSADKDKRGSEILQTPPRSTLNTKASNGTLSSLANKPIPPRPPRPPNAPSSFPACDMPDENKVYNHKSGPVSRDPSSSVERLIEERSSEPNPGLTSQPVDKTNVNSCPPPSPFTHANGHANGAVRPPNIPSKTISQYSSKPGNKDLSTPAPATGLTPAISEQDVRDMQRLIINATTVDECRLILRMFMARSGFSIDTEQPVSSKFSPYIEHSLHTSAEALLENSLVEMLLGNSCPESVAA